MKEMNKTWEESKKNIVKSIKEGLSERSDHTDNACVRERALEYQIGPEEEPSYAWEQKGKYTIDDYYALPDDQRVELIDGNFYDMAAPSSVHQLIIGELHLQFRACVEKSQGKCLVILSPSDVLVDKSRYTVVQPDIYLVCNQEKIQRQYIYGAPDLVVEILSPSSRKVDTFLKLNKYRSAGVREYWIVDPDKQSVTVYAFEEEGNPPKVFSFQSKVPIGISEGKCAIDFAHILEQIAPFLDR